MHYTENHNLNVLSPELNLVNQNQSEGNLNNETPQTLPPTYFEMNAVIPLEGETLMYFPIPIKI